MTRRKTIELISLLTICLVWFFLLFSHAEKLVRFNIRELIWLPYKSNTFGPMHSTHRRIKNRICIVLVESWTCACVPASIDSPYLYSSINHLNLIDEHDECVEMPHTNSQTHTNTQRNQRTRILKKIRFSSLTKCINYRTFPFLFSSQLWMALGATRAFFYDLCTCLLILN